MAIFVAAAVFEIAACVRDHLYTDLWALVCTCWFCVALCTCSMQTCASRILSAFVYTACALPERVWLSVSAHVCLCSAHSGQNKYIAEVLLSF